MYANLKSNKYNDLVNSTLLKLTKCKLCSKCFLNSRSFNYLLIKD